jgi:ABC-type amino acid transport substrate-binding protein
MIIEEGTGMKTRLSHYGLPVLVLVVFLMRTAPVFSQDQPPEIMQNTREPGLEIIQEDIPTSIIINYDEGLAPLSYSKDGEITGILVEALDNILVGKLGLQVEHRGYPRRRVPFLVKSEKSDAFCVSPVSHTKKYAWFTNRPVIISSPALFTGVSNPRGEEIGSISRINELRSFSQVDYLGSAWAKKTFPKDIRDDIHWVGSLETALKMLAINRYDIYIGNEIIGRYTLVKVGLADDIFVRSVSMGDRQLFHFGLRKTYPDARRIVADVDRALKEAEQDGTISMIVDKYLNPPGVSLE